jgi:hypothetical protein
MTMFDRITHDPNILAGRATLRGLRIIHRQNYAKARVIAASLSSRRRSTCSRSQVARR